MNVGREDFELPGYDHIRELVEDHVDIDAFRGLARQVVFECLADRVAFPDVGFQENALFSVIDIREHCFIQFASIVKQLQCVFSNLHVLQVLMRKTALWLMAFAPDRNNLENQHNEHLQPGEYTKKLQQDTPDRDAASF